MECKNMLSILKFNLYNLILCSPFLSDENIRNSLLHLYMEASLDMDAGKNCEHWYNKTDTTFRRHLLWLIEKVIKKLWLIKIFQTAKIIDVNHALNKNSPRKVWLACTLHYVIIHVIGLNEKMGNHISEWEDEKDLLLNHWIFVWNDCKLSTNQSILFHFCIAFTINDIYPVFTSFSHFSHFRKNIFSVY